VAGARRLGDTEAVPGSERERLRRTFDEAALSYHAARPDYPDALVDDLVAITGVDRTSRLLEVGCGTGKGTLPLARRGLRITCVELGPALAGEARRNLEDFPQVTVVVGAWEEWEGPPGAFDLVYAATAWQWLDPTTRYARAARLLRGGGHLAFWDAAHVFPPSGDPFFAEIQPVYDEIGAGKPGDGAGPAPDDLPDRRGEIEESGLFEVVAVRRYTWTLEYDADAYLDLLRTFSGHIAMAEADRGRLFGEIRRRLEQRPDQRLRRGWGAVLHIARRLG
jgi:SAM-dependent methyltransferase